MSGKISFSFSKVKTKTTLQARRPEVEEKVEYITSFDKNEKKSGDAPPPELIIESKPNASLKERVSNKRMQEIESANTNVSENKSVNKNISESKTETDEKVSLEKLAIQELIEGSKKASENEIVAIPLSKTAKEVDDGPVDYESVPISQFGYAMLRGMGWAPGKGVGKRQKVVEVVEPTLRAGRMCLGAKTPPIKDDAEAPTTKTKTA